MSLFIKPAFFCNHTAITVDSMTKDGIWGKKREVSRFRDVKKKMSLLSCYYV